MGPTEYSNSTRAYDELHRLVKDNIDAGVFDPSNSSYCSRWFVVVKKDGKSLWIVQSLEPLKEVTIAHSRVPSFTEQLAESFASHACNSMMDLYVGYDEHALAPSLRDALQSTPAHNITYGLDKFGSYLP
jgi:hypothetical protein